MNDTATQEEQPRYTQPENATVLPIKATERGGFCSTKIYLVPGQRGVFRHIAKVKKQEDAIPLMDNNLGTLVWLERWDDFTTFVKVAGLTDDRPF